MKNRELLWLIGWEVKERPTSIDVVHPKYGCWSVCPKIWGGTDYEEELGEKYGKILLSGKYDVTEPEGMVPLKDS